MSDKVQTASPKVLEAMARIEAESRERFQAELASSGIEAKKPLEPMNTASEALPDELQPAGSVVPRSHIAALRGDVAKVTRANPDKGIVHGPSAKSMAAGAKREAQVQLERIEAAAEARKVFTPERLHQDLKAKERLIAKQAKQIKDILARLNTLEGGA